MAEQRMIRADGTLSGILVHYLYRGPVGLSEANGAPLGGPGGESWKIACAPNMTEMGVAGGRSHPWQRTSEADPVTCPLCMETPQYQRAKRELEVARRSGGFVS